MTITILVLARTLHIGCAMLLVALPYFMLVVLGPAFGTDSVEGYDVFCRRILKGLWSAWLLEAVSGFVWFWFVAAEMCDDSPWGILGASDLSTVLWQTQFGQLWLTRAVVGIVLGLTIFLMSRRKTAFAPSPSFLDWLVLAVSGVLLVTLAWAGHAAAGIRFHVLHLVVDAAHLLLGALWPVGLIPLGCFLWHIRRRDEGVPADREIRILQRFSSTSLVAVLVLFLTGIINSWLMVGSWEGLATTMYGWLLVVKVLVVAMMIGCGAVNRFLILPRLGAEAALFQTLRRTVLAESGLALVVLLIVGMMGMTSPPS